MRSRMTGLAGIVGSVLVGAALLPGAAVAQDAPSTITILSTASPSMNALKEIATAYTAETGIEVVFVDVPSTQLATKIILAKAANQATFDIAQLNGPDLPVVVQAGAFLPLDAYIDGDASYDKADFPQGILDYAKHDGVTYAVPFSTEPFLHWYRTDLYANAGLELPTTWDELIANAPTFQEAGAYGFATAYGPASAATYFSQMLYTSGGRVLAEDNEPLLDTDYVKSVMAKFVGLAPYAPDSSIGGASADMITAFSQLDVASMMAASGWYSTVNSSEDSKVVGKFETGGLITAEGGPYPIASPLFGWLLGISPSSTNPDAAWAFLSYALGPGNVQAFVDAGAPPVARTSTITNPALIEKLPFLPAVEQAVASPTVLPRIPEWPQVATILSQQISAIATGQATVDEAMAKANSDILDVLVRAGRYTG